MSSELKIGDFLTEIKKNLIIPNSQRFEDLFENTNNIHTNIFEKGQTDATLKYFNMEKYFETK